MAEDEGAMIRDMRPVNLPPPEPEAEAEGWEMMDDDRPGLVVGEVGTGKVAVDELGERAVEVEVEDGRGLGVKVLCWD
jgi:hypothetical protein